MTASHPLDHSNADDCGEKLRMGIIMAVILCAGLAGGILLTAHFRDQAMGHETHAAGYLHDNTQNAVAGGTPDAIDATAQETANAAPVCEEYTKLVSIGGESQTIYGTACRQPDGTWDIMR